MKQMMKKIIKEIAEECIEEASEPEGAVAVEVEVAIVKSKRES